MDKIIKENSKRYFDELSEYNRGLKRSMEANCKFPPTLEDLEIYINNSVEKTGLFNNGYKTVEGNKVDEETASNISRRYFTSLIMFDELSTVVCKRLATSLTRLRERSYKCLMGDGSYKDAVDELYRFVFGIEIMNEKVSRMWNLEINTPKADKALDAVVNYVKDSTVANLEECVEMTADNFRRIVFSWFIKAHFNVFYDGDQFLEFSKGRFKGYDGDVCHDYHKYAENSFEEEDSKDDLDYNELVRCLADLLTGGPMFTDAFIDTYLDNCDRVGDYNGHIILLIRGTVKNYYNRILDFVEEEYGITN